MAALMVLVLSGPQVRSAAVMALISLDDLEGLDEQLDDDITDNTEPMGDEDGLLSHWQAVASTHQVSVPAGEGAGPDTHPIRGLLRGRGQTLIQSEACFPCVPEMTGPIQEMTRNRQQREPLPFVLITRHEKVQALTGTPGSE